MRKALVGIFLVGAWLAMPAPRSSADPPDCEAARCSVQSAVDTCCANAKNHGQFVSCVAHAVKASGIPTNCKGKVTRCAARSTCGKEGFSTCTPTCDTTTGTCVNDPTVTCTTNSDCGRCHTRPSGTCPAGTTEGSGSCCPTCTTPG
jgi:hypothetical protein